MRSSLRTRSALAVLATFVTITTLAACGADAPSAPAVAPRTPSGARSAAPTEQSALPRDLAAARAATARYHRVDAAIANGYVSTHECVAIPGAGMGIHFVHGPRIGDPSLDAAEPEVLVYEARGDGSLRLVAVEYMVSKPLWDAVHPGTRPTLYGRTFEDGPMQSYALHAWVWRHNADGMFAPFNPAVSCPTGGQASAHASHG
jgi:hypothetical protein